MDDLLLTGAPGVGHHDLSEPVALLERVLDFGEDAFGDVDGGAHDSLFRGELEQPGDPRLGDLEPGRDHRLREPALVIQVRHLHEQADLVERLVAARRHRGPPFSRAHQVRSRILRSTCQCE